MKDYAFRLNLSNNAYYGKFESYSEAKNKLHDFRNASIEKYSSYSNIKITKLNCYRLNFVRNNLHYSIQEDEHYNLVLRCKELKTTDYITSKCGSLSILKYRLTKDKPNIKFNTYSLFDKSYIEELFR